MKRPLFFGTKKSPTIRRNLGDRNGHLIRFYRHFRHGYLLNISYLTGGAWKKGVNPLKMMAILSIASLISVVI